MPDAAPDEPDRPPAVMLNGRPLSIAQVEQLERLTSRSIAQAIENHLPTIQQVFESDHDLAQDVAEDLTREALDRLGASSVGARLYSKCDYKQARYIFLPDDVVPQALFVDSKAEKGPGVRVQMTQTSMNVRQRRDGVVRDETPLLERVISVNGTEMLTTTVFVKYKYRDLGGPAAPAADDPELFAVDGDDHEGDADFDVEATPPAEGRRRVLDEVIVVVLPSGALQDVYNPDTDHSIWNIGANSSLRGESFRARISLRDLASHAGGDPDVSDASWRVRRFPLSEKGRADHRRWEADLARTRRPAPQTLPLPQPEAGDDELADASLEVSTVESVAEHLLASYSPVELDRLFEILTRPDPDGTVQA